MERLLSVASPLGLYAEEFDTSTADISATSTKPSPISRSSRQPDGLSSPSGFPNTRRELLRGHHGRKRRGRRWTRATRRSRERRTARPHTLTCPTLVFGEKALAPSARSSDSGGMARTRASRPSHTRPLADARPQAGTAGARQRAAARGAVPAAYSCIGTLPAAHAAITGSMMRQASSASSPRMKSIGLPWSISSIRWA